MASLPTTFSVGSFSSGQSVRNAIASYRRSQYFVAGSQVTAAFDTENFSDDETYSEAGDEETPFDVGRVRAANEDDDLDHFGWEAEDDSFGGRAASAQVPRTHRQKNQQPRIPRKSTRPRETTPLLRKAISFSTPSHPCWLSNPAFPERPARVVLEEPGMTFQPPPLQHRRLSASSAKSVRYNYGGKSTFGQTLNATIEILLGNDVPLSAPENMVSKSNGLTFTPRGSHFTSKSVYAIVQRLGVTVLSVMVSILVPEFDAMMALLGAFAAFLLCLIGPISAKVVLAGRCNLTDGILLVVGVLMATWGTAAAFRTT
ncbi:hypothetical protein H0H87_011029 [Tephrocybe sp. NHM501043]|nr:hypothetical protein H0H87_011029 [Tephrocybe sp. NHM501043]